MPVTVHLMKPSTDLESGPAHSFQLEADLPDNSIITHKGLYYVYYDSGTDEEGRWEEWKPAQVHEVNLMIGG